MLCDPQLSKFDREAAKKHAKARDEQFKVLSEKISKARKNSKSFKNASVVNVTRLNVRCAAAGYAWCGCL